MRPAHQHFVIGLGWLGIEGGKRQQRVSRLEQASPYRYFPRQTQGQAAISFDSCKCRRTLSFW